MQRIQISTNLNKRLINKLLESPLHGVLFKILIASYLIGSGMVYGHFRLFHLIGIVFLPFFLAAFAKNPQRLFKADLLLMLTLLAWYAVSFSWVKDFTLARNYFFYLLNGYYLIFAVCFYVTTFERLKQAFKILFFVGIADIFVGLLEALTKIRWFVSRQSQLNHFFNIDPMYEFYYKDLMNRVTDFPIAYEFMLHQPSGFQWGPNQFGLFLCLSLPFILFCVKRVWLSNLLVAVTLYLSFMIASRAVFLSQFVTILISIIVFYFFSKKKMLFASLMLALLIMVPAAPLEKLGINYERATKISGFYGAAKNYVKKTSPKISQKYQKLEPDQLKNLHVLDKDEEAKFIDNSVSQRKIMLSKAFDAFSHRMALGVGLGNSAQEVGLLFGITQIHNFWAEILFELGLVFGLLAYLGFAALFLRLCYLFFRSYKAKNNEYMMILMAFIVSITTAVPGALAVGTVVYQSIFWLVLAFSLATVKIIGADKSIIK